MIKYNNLDLFTKAHFWSFCWTKRSFNYWHPVAETVLWCGDPTADCVPLSLLITLLQVPLPLRMQGTLFASNRKANLTSAITAITVIDLERLVLAQNYLKLWYRNAVSWKGVVLGFFFAKTDTNIWSGTNYWLSYENVSILPGNVASLHINHILKFNLSISIYQESFCKVDTYQ